jgi:hypothetical protein
MFFQDFSHRIVDGLHRTQTIGGDELILPEDLDQNRSFGGATYRFRGLEVNLIVNLTAEHAKGP